MTRLAAAALLVLALPAAATTPEEQQRYGEAKVHELADAAGYGELAKSARHSLGKGRTASSRRWATCWCFVAGLDGVSLTSPAYSAGCQWFASFGQVAELAHGEEVGIRYCAARP